MGMFDYVEGECICPKCKKKTKLSDQIKWSKCLMNYYHKGNVIDAADGEYDYGSAVRPYLFSECDNCKDFVQFSIIVENGILKEFRPLRTLNKDEVRKYYRSSPEEFIQYINSIKEKEENENKKNSVKG